MSGDSIAYDRVVAALESRGSTVKQNGRSTVATCPSHEDSSPSLSVTPITESVLLYCHAGCQQDDVLAALDLQRRDLYDNPRGRTYTYHGGRQVHRSPDKQFRQSGNTKDSSLYRLDELRLAVEYGQTVYVVEGEKDCDALVSITGKVATCSPMGAGKWHTVDPSPLFDADVTVVVDKDQPGRKHAVDIMKSLGGKAKSLRFVEARSGKDLADHLAAGHQLADLVTIDLAERSNNNHPQRRHRVTWATGIDTAPVVWAWSEGSHDRIPAGSLTIAAGREGTGKSSFAIWKSAMISRGLLPGSFYGRPRNVLYVAIEDSWRYTIVPRLIAAGADLSRVGRFDIISTDDGNLTMSLPSDNDLLEAAVTEHHVAWTVIDPVMSVIGAGLDTHKEREVREALDPLAGIADRTGAVIEGIAHFNKSASSDVATLITGSGAFKNVPRSVFGFAVDHDGSRVMTQVKNSLGRLGLPSLGYAIEEAEVITSTGAPTTVGHFVFTGESDVTVQDILESAHEPKETRRERSEITSWLIEYLADAGGVAEARDVEAAGRNAGYDAQAIKDARRRSKDPVIGTKRTGFGKGSSVTWTLSP